LLGAGGGGFLLFYAPPELHPKICEALSDLRRIPFSLELRGSRIVFVN
jgi:D-glycero-alpha-D-manno-heptose-7-phosphate kinase